MKGGLRTSGQEKLQSAHNDRRYGVCRCPAGIADFYILFFRNQIIPQTRQALEDKAITIARTIALIPLVSEGLSEGNSKEIQDYTSRIARRNDIMFVVVTDMKGIRYSHPDASLVGLPFAGGGQEISLRGGESISEGAGPLGRSLRGFVPVYNNRGGIRWVWSLLVCPWSGSSGWFC
ncbi:hypothetical protein ACFTAO_10460 [Paenibacillus rhizoplanae]